MVFNDTFNNSSVISWWSVLLGEETGVPRENRRLAASHWPSISHNVVSIKCNSPWAGFELITLVVIGTDCTCSCKSNYHTVTTTLAHLGAVGCKSNYHTVTTTLANLGAAVGCKSSYHTETTTLANLGAVGCKSNYHTVTTTLANLGAVGCKSNYHTVTTTLANLEAIGCKSNYHTVTTTLANLGLLVVSPTIIRSRQPLLI